jgi:chromosome segregation ATPase
MSELKTMTTKLGGKKIAIIKDETKIKNLDQQIDLYTTARDKARAGMEQKQDEVDRMVVLVDEYKTLDREKNENLAKMKDLIAKYDTIPWRPDLSPEEKIENSEYPTLEKRVAEIQSRMNEIPPMVNRIYYRRGTDEVSGD